MNAREVIARHTGMCHYAFLASIAHDHSKCLAEADEVLAALDRAGYEVTGVTTLPDLEGAT